MRKCYRRVQPYISCITVNSYGIGGLVWDLYINAWVYLIGQSEQ